MIRRRRLQVDAGAREPGEVEPCPYCEEYGWGPEDYLAESMLLTAGVGAINTTLQMMMAQSVAFGEGIRAAQQSAALARTAEFAALGTMIAQMFPVRQTQVRETAIQRTVTQAPPMLAVS